MSLSIHGGGTITLDRPTHSSAELMTVAGGLLRQIYRPGYLYKKTGVQLVNLVSEDEYQPGAVDTRVVAGDALPGDEKVRGCVSWWWFCSLNY
ncbi:MAG: hypothetical protein K8R38_05375 [Verrucomicrobia bacterium]|nr:hypothetical protein [Verrucomicrobiota bacterium]